MKSKTNKRKAKARADSLQRRVSHATVETYYAVRIGTPGRNAPYFMVRRDGPVPWLFVSRLAAEAECPLQPATRVVKVCVSHG